MEWTDTLILDTVRSECDADCQSALLAARVVTSKGITFLHTDVSSHSDATASLELLRGFKGAARRVVLCDPSKLAAGKQLGQTVVELGLAQVLVTCGRSGREVGIGARDAGLDLNSVVVCENSAAGFRVLTKLTSVGDTVLILGIEPSAVQQWIDSLEEDFSNRLAAA